MADLGIFLLIAELVEYRDDHRSSLVTMDRILKGLKAKAMETLFLERPSSEIFTTISRLIYL